jgi:hypothetical protein
MQTCRIYTRTDSGKVFGIAEKQGFQDGGANPMTGEVIYVQSLDPDVKTLLTPYKIGNMVF